MVFSIAPIIDTSTVNVSPSAMFSNVRERVVAGGRDVNRLACLVDRNFKPVAEVVPVVDHFQSRSHHPLRHFCCFRTASGTGPDALYGLDGQDGVPVGPFCTGRYQRSISASRLRAMRSRPSLSIEVNQLGPEHIAPGQLLVTTAW